MRIDRRTVIRYQGDGRERLVDELAPEEPVELRLGSTPLAVLMCSPDDVADLALGFALTEGILLHPNELAGIRRVGDGERHELVLADGVVVDPDQFRRNAYTTSSCGVCGKASIDAVRVSARPIEPGPRLSPSRIEGFVDALAESQPGFRATGAVHGAALLDPDGTTLASAEDVGRHNAVDKTIGAAARARWPLGGTVLAVSGRISFEIAQKAAVAAIPVVVGVSAASSLAAELAEDLGMTLVGFAREGGFVVYAGSERIGD